MAGPDSKNGARPDLAPSRGFTSGSEWIRGSKGPERGRNGEEGRVMDMSRSRRVGRPVLVRFPSICGTVAILVGLSCGGLLDFRAMAQAPARSGSRFIPNDSDDAETTPEECGQPGEGSSVVRVARPLSEGHRAARREGGEGPQGGARRGRVRRVRALHGRPEVLPSPDRPASTRGAGDLPQPGRLDREPLVSRWGRASRRRPAPPRGGPGVLQLLGR